MPDIYRKRKKKSFEDEKQTVGFRYRKQIILLLAVIIIVGAIAAVHAVENHRQVQLQAMSSDTGETVTYYYDGDANNAGGTAGAAGADEQLTGTGAGTGAVTGSGSADGTGLAGTDSSAGSNAANGSGTDSSSAAAYDLLGQNTGYPDFSQNEISWNGRTYKRNAHIKPILCMGIDNSGDMVTEREYGYAGQCDGIFLIAQDTAHNTVKILMIPRDTMTTVMEMNPDTGIIEPYIDHITLSFCFGDGRQTSCENSRQAVSTLLMNLPVTDYMAVDTAVVADVNDAVGGVEVTIPTEGMEQIDAAFVYGSTITLKGKQAEKFVRYRDVTIDNSALQRLSQHRQYIEGFFTALKAQTKADSQTVVKLMDMVQDYMVTNMQKDSYMKTALDVLQNGDITDSNMLTLPGYGTATDTFDEYYANKDSVAEIVLSLFYREV